MQLHIRGALVAALALAAGLAGAQTGAPMPAGDAARGQMLYESRCVACHSVDEDRVGPHHRGVVGRRAGSVPGFEYSDALANANFRWSAALINRWLTDPEQLVPGQKMGYRLDEAIDRADVIAYLATLK